MGHIHATSMLDKKNAFKISYNTPHSKLIKINQQNVRKMEKNISD